MTKPERQIYYELNEHREAVPTDAQGAERALHGDRSVRRTVVEGQLVSTVFLAIDHALDDGPPLLFETMVFESEDADAETLCERYSTWEEAEKGHEEIVRQVREELAKPPPPEIYDAIFEAIDEAIIQASMEMEKWAGYSKGRTISARDDRGRYVEAKRWLQLRLKREEEDER